MAGVGKESRRRKQPDISTAKSDTGNPIQPGFSSSRPQLGKRKNTKKADIGSLDRPRPKVFKSQQKTPDTSKPPSTSTRSKGKAKADNHSTSKTQSSASSRVSSDSMDMDKTKVTSDRFTDKALMEVEHDIHSQDNEMDSFAENEDMLVMDESGMMNYGNSSDDDHDQNEGDWHTYFEDDNEDMDDFFDGKNDDNDDNDDEFFKSGQTSHISKNDSDSDDDNHNDNSINSDSRNDDMDADDHSQDDMDDLDDADVGRLSRLRRNLGLHMHDLFGGVMSGMSGQFRNILENLSNSDDQTQQLIALQELAETLSISSEENLTGFFQCDAFVKELVKIMKGSNADPTLGATEDDMMLAIALSEQYGGGNPELMLLACRCLSNLLDVLPSAASSVVSHGAIEVLCDKLKSIQYIDLAEQALGALEKVASQVPQAVIQNGGLSASLMYFDFFSIHSQRTALQTASHCMRNIGVDSSSQVLEIIPILTNTLTYSDRTVIELTCLCWARLAESYRSNPTAFEKVISMDVLKTMIGLLPVSGNSNAVRSGTFNDILRVFRCVSKASPELGYQLLNLDIVGYFYQILTGAHNLPPSNEVLHTGTPASLAMISLDNKWRDSLYTVLKIIIDLLPPLPKNEIFSWKRFQGTEPVALRTRSAKSIQPESLSQPSSPTSTSSSSPPSPSSSLASQSGQSIENASPDPRIQLFKENSELLQRIGFILFPLLLEIYSSTVNLRVRQLVTHILVKLVFFMDSDALKIVLKHVNLSGFLVGLLAQQEQTTFVIDALFQAEFLLEKLPDVYYILFQREGVYYEINTLANKSLVEEGVSAKMHQSLEGTILAPSIDDLSMISETNSESGQSSTQSTSQSMEERLFTDSPILASNQRRSARSDTSQQMSNLLERSFMMRRLQKNRSRLETHPSTMSSIREGEAGIGHGALRRFVIQLAQHFIKIYSTAQQTDRADPLINSLHKLQQFGQGLVGTTDDPAARNILENFVSYIDGSTIGISGFELLRSGMLEALLGYLTQSNDGDKRQIQYMASVNQRRQTFYSVFMETLKLNEEEENGMMASPSLRLLVKRLEDLFTQFERFEVVSPLGSSLSSSDSIRNPVHLLAKQIRIRLTGQGPGIPAEYQHLMVATHAVATFRVLEEYLLAHIHDPNDILMTDKTICADEEEDFDDDEKTSPPEQMNLDDDEQNSKFYMEGTMISSDSTVYGAIHRNEIRKQNQSDPQTTNHPIWSTAYPVTYKRVFVTDDTDITKKAENSSLQQTDNSQLPKQLPDMDAICLNILRLLKELATLSGAWEAINQSPSAIITTTETPSLVPMTEFVNRKLAAKMQRQLEEPLIVASSCLPEWVYYFMGNYPFLFPFDVRHLFIQSTSFGYSRLIARWQSMQMRNNTQNGQRHDGQGGYTNDSGSGRSIEGGSSQQQQQQPTLGRMERKKVMVKRNQILEYTIKIMRLFGNSQPVLEIEYVDEEGTGLGPTLEFYSLASKEFSKQSTNMWRQDDDISDIDDAKMTLSGVNTSSEEEVNKDIYVVAKRGLFPAPLSRYKDTRSRKKIIQLFKTLGQFVAKAMLDFRIIDIPFSVAFFKLLLHDDVTPLEILKEIDPTLARSVSHLQAYVDKKHLMEQDISLKSDQIQAIENITINGAKIQDLCLDFTLPGYPNIELKRGGSQIPVTMDNVEEYIYLLTDMIAGSGIKEQISAFRDGFSGLFPIEDLKVLTCEELVSLFGAANEDWSYATLLDTIKADHGYTMESNTVKHLLEVLSEMTNEEKREFLQFTTGSPRLPIGGWKAMRPMFTVVRKNCEAPLVADDYLPSVMTCANYLKMPDYSTKAILRKQLFKSMQEGKNSFLLS
ncbi:uncharacterized protein BX664DRAFT_387876 [Halteromyces radiatus]|uniref:uncharacterized protein n=1 Tax=Halteromyces radiatus TaxID=101107 RepID=UPI0022207A46|nr:uncharacterized protein BX664DRAFT_387876 [Halteromyces radiatus]KAI8082723.1 hypothetical protein BX664DRAFT_387876 [Halteromyces radiatus]